MAGMQRKLEVGHLLAVTIQVLVRTPLQASLYVVVCVAVDIFLRSDNPNIGIGDIASIPASFGMGFILLRSMLHAHGLVTDSIFYDFTGYFTVYVITMIAIWLGLALFVIPGAILAARWLPALPICLVELTGVRETLRRSRAMTSGNGWPILAAIMVTGLPALVLTVGAITAEASLGLQLIQQHLTWILAVLSAAYWGGSALLWAMTISTYLLLRSDAKELAETFA